MNSQILTLLCVTAITVLSGCANNDHPNNQYPSKYSQNTYVSKNANTQSTANISNSTDPILPNHKMTPGAIFPVTITDICVDGYTKVVRKVSIADRKAAYAEYNIINVRGEHELDHLISLELGGNNSLKNLWPEPYHTVWNARVKDRLENKLHAMVCATPQEMTLAQAQSAISNDWVAAYKKYIGPQPTSKRTYRSHHTEAYS